MVLEMARGRKRGGGGGFAEKGRCLSEKTQPLGPGGGRRAGVRTEATAPVFPEAKFSPLCVEPRGYCHLTSSTGAEQ